MTLSVQLGLLEGAGLIQLASIQPELEYIFRHVLVKDAAYHSLVKSERRRAASAVGETLPNDSRRGPAQSCRARYPLPAIERRRRLPVPLAPDLGPRGAG